MTLAELVKEEVPSLKMNKITHMALCDIYTIIYEGTLIGYYNPIHNELRIDSSEVSRITK